MNDELIGCPNCKFEGKPNRTTVNTALFWGSFLFGALGLVFYLPLFLICALVFLWLVFRPAKQSCPTCGFAYVIPIEHWRKTAHPGTSN